MSAHSFKIDAQPFQHIAAAVSAFPNVGRRIEAAPIERKIRIDPLFERSNAAVKPCEREQGRCPVFAFDAELNPIGPSRPAHMILVQASDDPKRPFASTLQFEHDPVRAYSDIAVAKAAQLRGYILAELRFAGLQRR